MPEVEYKTQKLNSVFPCQFFPNGSIRIAIPYQGVRLHLARVAVCLWRHVAPPSDHDRSQEVLVKVIHILDDSSVHRTRNTHEIKYGQMLDVFAQPHPPSVWTNRYAKFCSHEQHGDDLIHSSQATAVDLTEVHRFCCQKLLEHDFIVAMLACGYSDAKLA